MKTELSFNKGLKTLEEKNAIERLIKRDGSLFSKSPLVAKSIEDRLGWISMTFDVIPYYESLEFLAEEAQVRGIDRVVVIGMGGSTLAPEVYRRNFGKKSDIQLEIVDYSFPAAIQKLLKELDFEKTFFIVASKSGTTIETMFLSRIFYQKGRKKLGDAIASHFIAITNTATPLHEMAQAQEWLHVIFARSSVGGRFSALSNFGLVPTVFLDIDYKPFFERASEMEKRCQDTNLENNPGAQLANFLYHAHSSKRPLVMIAISEKYSGLGHWLEQLIAESLGKKGKGIAPLITTAERLKRIPHTAMSIICIADHEDEELCAFYDSIEAEVPHAFISLDDKNQLAAEFIRWEYAVTLTGLLMGVNPLDQPNVAAAKASAMNVLMGEEDEAYELLPLNDLASQVREGDYLAILAFMEEKENNTSKLLQSALAIEKELQIPVTIGYGPRYLHSIGQLYKGGPDNVLFLVVSELNRGVDISIPREHWTLKEVLSAQKKGDIISLLKQGRRVFQAQNLKELSAKFPSSPSK